MATPRPSPAPRGAPTDGSTHAPVLPAEVRRLAGVAVGERWVDCTLGFGGHAEALLDAGATVLGVDQDPTARAAAAQRLAAYGGRLRVVAGNFRDLGALLDAAGWAEVDGILADVGVSSWQLDTAERGFSFAHAGPVDMRMDPTAGLTAAERIAAATVPELAEWIRTLGEEPYAGPIARAIKAWQAAAAAKDTASLAAAVAASLPAQERARRRTHPATRTFQALRIVVNDELGALDALLATAPARLASGGRFLVISFHSLEDRRVKQAFAALCGRADAPAPRRGLPPPPKAPPAFAALTRKAVVADEAELAHNPRARSARLRAILRPGGPA